MKSKIVLFMVAIMITLTSLVGCNAMKKGMDEVMPSDMPTASSVADN